MFKTKKTQFAIRKLSKGAAAVLLSFGILSSTCAPLVSAATTETETEKVETKTENTEQNLSTGAATEKSNHAHPHRGASDWNLWYHHKEVEHADSTRTIKITNPENETQTITQEVEFSRTKYYCTYDKNPCPTEYTDWKAQGAKTWDTYTIPIIEGYDIYINDQKANSNVISQVTPEVGKQEELNVTYVKQPKQTIVPTDPAKPEEAEFFKTITRTITTKYADGKEAITEQKAIFYQTKTGDTFNEDWKPWNGQDKWDAITPTQYPGHKCTITIDGKEVTKISDVQVNADSNNSNVEIKYEYTDAVMSTVNVKFTENGKEVGALTPIGLYPGQKISIDNLKNQIGEFLKEKGYAIDGDLNLPTNDIVAGETKKDQVFEIKVKPATQTIKPDDLSNEEAIKQDLRRIKTRTIQIQKPNQEVTTKTQTVTFERNKIVQGNDTTHSDWKCVSGDNRWDKFNVDPVDGYQSYVDGKLNNVIEEKDVNVDSKDETVYVSYLDEKYADIKISYQTGDGKTVKDLDKIDLKGSQKLTLAELNEKIKDQIPKGYHITQVTGMPEKDILASDYPNNASLDITITIEADEKYAYDYEDGDLIKRWIRHIYVVKPNEERKLSEIQKVTYVRKKVHKNNVNPASALSARANTNEWEYSDWELHKTEGNSGKWSSYKVEKIDKHKAVVKYPKFLDDPEDREIEADEIEERAVPVPALENDEDEIREVEVNYVPVKDEAPVDPDTPDTPVIPDNPDNDKPSNPDDSSSDTQDPVKPENPGQDDNNSSSSDSSVNNPTDSYNNSSNTSGSEKSTSSFLNPNPSLNVRPLGESPQSTNVTTNNEKLPQSGAGATLSTEVAGLISIAASTVIGAIGYVIGRKKKK